jgi:hypothetical protein
VAVTIRMKRLVQGLFFFGNDLIGPALDLRSCNANEMFTHETGAIAGDARHDEGDEGPGENRVGRIANRQSNRNRQGERDETE